MPFRHRARPAVADGGEGLAGRPLDLLEVVVARAHFVPHGCVGRPGAALAGGGGVDSGVRDPERP